MSSEELPGIGEETDDGEASGRDQDRVNERSVNAADSEWDDFAEARRPRLADVLRGAGLAFGAGLLITLAGVGTVVALVVVSLGPSRRNGPGDGRNSRHLPIAVAPADGLRDGSPLRVRASRLVGAGAAVIASCAAEADDRNRGVAACDMSHRTKVAVRHGKVRASFRAPRLVALADGTQVDCASEAGRCVLMVASAENYDRSGFVPLTFRPLPG